MTEAKLKLLNTPSPIETLPALSSRFGVSVHIKREDSLDGFIGGTKSRLIEYLFHEILSESATDLITVGEFNSNQCRVLSYLAKLHGLTAHIFLRSGTPDGRRDPNLALTRLFEPRIYPIDDKEWSFHLLKVSALEKQLKAEGRKPRFVPFGCGTPYSVLGIRDLVNEIFEQIGSPDFIVLPYGSGTTTWGLDLWLQQREARTQLFSVPLETTQEKAATRVDRFYEEYNRKHGTRFARTANLHFVEPDTHPTDANAEVARIFREDLVLLDAVYGLRPYLSLRRILESGGIPRGSKVVFLKTGQAFNLL